MKDDTRDFHMTGNASIRRTQKMPVLVFLFLLLLSGLIAGSGAFAQPVNNEAENSRHETEGAKADFLFGEPTRYFSLRLGTFFPQVDSNLFDMVTRELTLQKSDFRALDFGVDMGFNLSERFDLVVRLDYADSSNTSEFRDYVDEQGLPIEQETEFLQIAITSGVKYLFVSRGQAVGHYAWLPNRFVPFVEAGVGGLWYRFEQGGDFVDYATLQIFHTYLESSDWAPTVYLGGGVDINLNKSLYVTLDLRYSWAKRDLSGDFTGFEPIDLSGFRITTGISFHY